VRLALGLVLLSSLAWAQPQSPLFAPTRARLAQLDKTAKDSNAYVVLEPVLLRSQSKVREECKGLADCMSAWPKPELIGDKIKQAPDFARARKRFSKALAGLEPGLKRPNFYAKPDLKEKNIPNWMALVDVCAAQNVMGYDEVRNGRVDPGLDMIMGSLAISQRISGNGILIQQMIALKIGSQADETLLQCLQKNKLPIASLRKLHKQLLNLRPRAEDLALALDIEQLCNVTALSDFLKGPELAPLTQFYFHWRPSIAKLQPTARWKAGYLKERDDLARTQAYFLGLKDIDFTVLEDHWKDRLTRHSALMLWLELEIWHADRGTYPANLTGFKWTDCSADGPFLYTRAGKDFHLESNSSAWDSNTDRSQRKATLRRFH